MAATTANSNSKVYQFKLVLLGESAVGKSSLVLRFVRGQFFDYQESTIGGKISLLCIIALERILYNNWFLFGCTAAFLTQTVALSDSTVKFEIWDTAGQERYHSLAPMYYRGAAAAIVVYDITSPVWIKYQYWALYIYQFFNLLVRHESIFDIILLLRNIFILIRWKWIISYSHF